MKEVHSGIALSKSRGHMEVTWRVGIRLHAISYICFDVASSAHTCGYRRVIRIKLQPGSQMGPVNMLAIVEGELQLHHSPLRGGLWSLAIGYYLSVQGCEQHPLFPTLSDERCGMMVNRKLQNYSPIKEEWNITKGDSERRTQEDQKFLIPGIKFY